MSAEAPYLTTPEHLRRGPFALRGALASAQAHAPFLFEPDGILEVDGAGLIRWVGPASAYRGAVPVTDVRPMWILPGMIDLHGHLPQFPMAGMNDYGREVMPWIVEVMSPTERRFDGPRSRSTARWTRRRPTRPSPPPAAMGSACCSASA